MRPVPPGERILSIDVLRGVAVLGILFVNMLWFAQPALYMEQAGIRWWTQPWDLAAEAFIRFAAEGKFITMFSFLFGLGMAIQMRRARRKGVPFAGLYARRLLILLVIGLAHGLLLWHGDILTAYAVLGFGLLLLRHTDTHALVGWAVVLILVPVALAGAVAGLVALASLTPDGAERMQAAMQEQQEMLVGLVERSVEAYRHGGYPETLERRARDFTFMWSYFFLWLPPILGLFLVGLMAGRREIFRRAGEERPLLRRITFWGLVVGLPANALHAWGTLRGLSGMDGSLLGFALSAVHSVGAPVLAFGYMAGLTLLLTRPRWQRGMTPFAAVGRMAFTNYLAQSLICTTLFYGYGLGLYGRVGPAAGLALTLGIFALQLAWSPWWLNRFRYGPVEWLWRSLTYGRLEPFRASGEEP